MAFSRPAGDEVADKSERILPHQYSKHANTQNWQSQIDTTMCMLVVLFEAMCVSDHPWRIGTRLMAKIWCNNDQRRLAGDQCLGKLKCVGTRAHVGCRSLPGLISAASGAAPLPFSQGRSVLHCSLQVVVRYAVNNPHCSLNCKKVSSRCFRFAPFGNVQN